jgi:hypothetical protein
MAGSIPRALTMLGSWGDLLVPEIAESGDPRDLEEPRYGRRLLTNLASGRRSGRRNGTPREPLRWVLFHESPAEICSNVLA